MRSLLIGVVSIVSLLCALGCDQVEPRQGALHLPEGDADQGAQHFVSLGCVGCHQVVGADLPEPDKAGPVRVLLGSKTGRTMSYNQLVTSVVNPSHRLSSRYRKDKVSSEGQSLMTSYNDVMTVTQLTDLVAFLQAHYVKAERPGYKYPVYDYRSESEDSSEEPTSGN